MLKNTQEQDGWRADLIKDGEMGFPVEGRLAQGDGKCPISSGREKGRGSHPPGELNGVLNGVLNYIVNPLRGLLL